MEERSITKERERKTDTGPKAPSPPGDRRHQVAVRLHRVIKIYRSMSVEVVALRELDLEVGSGEFVAVVGPSGSGKTTMLNIIGGLDRPSAGVVEVMGLDPTRLGLNQLSDFRARTVGMVFQFFNLIPDLTAEENVELPMRIVGVPRRQRRRRVQMLLESVQISKRAHHLPSQLSGGEQQRVALAVALANDPPLLLVDEPTGELDSKSGRVVLALLRSLSKAHGKTVIVATHDRRISGFADTIMTIVDGKITRTRRLRS